VYV
jgi:hypothetical protein